jgi:hypothetical protein
VPLTAAWAAAAAAATTLPALSAYRSSASPSHQALEAVARVQPDDDAIVFGHHIYERYLHSGRTVDRLKSDAGARAALLTYWKEGGRRPVLFLADPRRLTLLFFGRDTQQSLGYWAWPDAVRGFMQGEQPAGGGSVAEQDKDEAELIAKGEVEEPELFYFHRQASDGHDLKTLAGRIEAVREASGPAAAWSDLRGIAKQWDRVGADMSYLERVWLNRWTQSEAQAFDAKRWRELRRPDYRIPAGAAVTGGFDGSRWKDTTALVVTEVATGFQHRFGLWVPEDCPDDEVPVAEVDEAVDEMFSRWHVVRFYGDPARGWDTRLAAWSGRHGPKVVAEFYTDSRNIRKTALMCRTYAQAIKADEVTNDGDDDFFQHIGHTQKRDTRLLDEEGKPLWVMTKERPDSPKKIDLAMAGGLSWQARLDALAAGGWQAPEPEDNSVIVFR